VVATELAAVEPSLPHGPTYWVVASQTCNLYNGNFEKIPKVEWIAASAVEETKRDAMLRGGRNPRLLEVMASDGKEGLWIVCDCQQRHWGTRANLASLCPQLALKDEFGADADSRYKDIFVRWLARGYTRLELSDELGGALTDGKFSQAIATLVKAHEKSIFGIFLKLDPDNETEKNPEEIKPPCGVDMAVVVRNESDQQKIKDKLRELFDDKTVPHSPNKISRAEALKASFDVSLVHAVIPAVRWNVTDIENSIRYNFHDHLSGSDEAGGE